MLGLVSVAGIGVVPVALGGALEEPAAFVIELRDDPLVPRGQLAIIEGSTSSQGIWLKLPSLSVEQPVRVALSTVGDGPPLTLQLRKFHWSAPLRELSTATAGQSDTHFRTAGDLFLRVLANGDEQGFRLMIWVDEKQEPAMEPVIRPKTTGG
ncbi:MAG: hypothetical protein WBM40_21380 [Thiohalocapsa sp.]